MGLKGVRGGTLQLLLYVWVGAAWYFWGRQWRPYEVDNAATIEWFHFMWVCIITEDIKDCWDERASPVL